MKEVVEHLERMAETLDGVTEENWLDTPQDIAKIYRSVANEIKHKMSVKSNAAAMYEALSEILHLIDKWRTDGVMEHWQYSQLFDVADKALAAPPRNCDVFEGHTVEYEFEKAMRFPPSKTADERDELMRENWFLFKLWLYAEAKGEQK